MGSITNFYDIPGLPQLETPDEVAATIAEFEEAGVDLLLLKCSPQLEEMGRLSATEVIRRTERVRNSD